MNRCRFGLGLACSMEQSGGDARRAERLAARFFVVGVAGLPVWWLLGLVSIVPLLVAGVLAWDLWTRRRLVLPLHVGWWLLFLGWVLLGIGTLWASAPGAVDGDGTGRVVVFGYRFGWYLACTIVLVWVSNCSPRVLADRAVHRLFATVFVVAVAGGLAGVLVPDLVVTTPAQRLLPGGLRGNEFVVTLVSAEVSDVQQVLGDPSPRPKAPFAFTNTWGSVISLTLVFFVAAARAAGVRWRWVALPVLVAAAVPVVLSLNRGLWLALAAGVVGLLVLLAVRQRPAALVALIAVAVIGGTMLTQTPLGDTLDARLDSPHSNDRRSQLVVATVDSVTRGSPAVGFGGTRDVQGTFASIAGGATPECPACDVPPLGTQGQLWLVLFSQGWIGALFFLTFFALALRRCWRCRTTNETIAAFVVGIFLLQLSVYDTLGLPMLVVMAALGLVARESGAVARATRPTNRQLATVGVVAVVGGGAGLLVATQTERQVTSTVTVALTPLPTYLDVGEAARTVEASRSTVEPPEAATIDTEAALLRSEPVLARTSDRVATSADELREAISVTAPPHSTVLDITIGLPAPSAGANSGHVTTVLAEEYLAERRRLMEHRRIELIGQLEGELAGINPHDPAWAGTRTYLHEAIDHLSVHTPAVGEILRAEDDRLAARRMAVPLTTGVALGLLVGVAVVRTAPVRRRR